MFPLINDGAPEAELGAVENGSGDFANHAAIPPTEEKSPATEIDERGAHTADGKAAVQNDAFLVAAARQGDREAFGMLVERHRRACLKRAMLIMRNKGDAEDEVQNALWKALERFDQFRAEGSFGAWLNRIVENQCLMRIREQRNCRFVYLDEPADQEVKLELVGQTADPEDLLGSDEVFSLLKREVSRIPHMLRDVMLMRDLRGNAMPAIALQLGLSIPAAKSRLMRARMELRSRLSKHCGRKGAATLSQMRRNPVTAYTRAS